ncbi:MAG: RagB/SusD family nutrient uptake outer membrane protein [Bacteroides sp.]|nr:RagB/SusD family nutrient uptake outer membrane protein [Bacteroides sp.]MCM1095219.1 RagB/SusD family nutrient uptake outer membrane protein [Terasakiella sp.]
MKAIHISLLAAAALTLVGCDLDQTPQSSLSPENSFKTENELRLYVNALLPMMTGTSIETADNGITKSLPDYMTGMRSSTISAGSWGWTNLRKVNILFKYSPNCPDEAVRLKYEAMGHFLRAKFYYEKLKTFGGVPWYEEVLEDNSPELYNPRDSREYVASKILDELDIALESLPTAKSINTITRWSALALKSRFCLFEGTFRKYHGIEGADAYLRECVDAADALISSGKFSIDKTGGVNVAYRDLFAQPATGDASPTEVINAEAYSFALGVKHGFNYTLRNTAGNRYGFEKTFVNSYLMADGSRFTDRAGYATMTFAEEFAGRDPRMTQTIAGPGFTRVGETSTTSDVLLDCFMQSVTGYFPIKYYAAPIADSQNSNENDLIIYRLAEVMLNLAEAKAELGTLTQDDLDRTVILIRDRVGMPPLDMAAANADPDPYMAALYPAVDGANKGVILEIRRERRIEMAMEGLRYDDVMRWKAGALFVPQFLGAYFPGTGGYDLDGDGKNDIYLYEDSRPPTPLLRGAKPLKLGLDITLSEGSKGYMVVNTERQKSWREDRDYLAPIPKRSLVLNPNLEQNPGWDK